ncbi:50S ribosomal protein L11 methyltransferase [uncultured Methanosphaera sp.]|uniref:50S ribosomal protein L11 methyltransferase n=1 Tax=uncultured Methanosphaera sp. TaxID=262501 RepID=UPI0025CE8BEE|nr:50S ribosomal protein L11 methyltransferase [uncultured Methanosphaera sp.]
MKCNCEKNCIQTKKEVLDNINQLYKPCSNCTKSKIKKSIPLRRQIKLDKIDSNYNKCPTCGKRHIDTVMAHILKIMINNNIVSASSSIRKVGSPLITPAIPLQNSPYLSENTLVILIPKIDENIAQLIHEEVPEVKAVMKGDINNTVGQLNETSNIHQYELLAGCDIRCDIQPTQYGNVYIYKQQSKIHIEYPKIESPKIIDVDRVLDEYENPTVIDATCGPGTLGIYALIKNAKNVLFNDIYKPAIIATKTNLEINEISEDKYEITNKDIFELVDNLEQYDIGFIDAFPGVDTEEYKKILEKVCDKVIII